MNFEIEDRLVPVLQIMLRDSLHTTDQFMDVEKDLAPGVRDRVGRYREDQELVIGLVAKQVADYSAIGVPEKE